MQFGLKINFIISISFLTASSYVQTVIPYPSYLLKYYLCFLKVNLLNLFIAYYLFVPLLCPKLTSEIFWHSFILHILPYASKLFFYIILY